MDELQFYYSKDRIIFNNVDCNANMQSRICIVSNDNLQFIYSEDKIIFNNVDCNANMQWYRKHVKTDGQENIHNFMYNCV